MLYKENVGYMISIFAVVVCAIGFFCLGYYNHIISKSEWNCAKSRILDLKNVNKVECILYKKVDHE